MGLNKYQPHLLILSEDDAYKDIANGFAKHFAVVSRNILIDTPAGGWSKLLELFSKEYQQSVRTYYPHRHVLLLLDLDGRPERASEVLRQIPADIQDRVFLLCGLDTAERIKRVLGSGLSEDIGEQLAQSCLDATYANSNSPWACSQLQHNRNQLERLATAVRPFLF